VQPFKLYASAPFKPQDKVDAATIRDNDGSSTDCISPSTYKDSTENHTAQASFYASYRQSFQYIRASSRLWVQ
jgi:hypothetical protein